jgi:hypothetical protein
VVFWESTREKRARRNRGKSQDVYIPEPPWLQGNRCREYTERARDLATEGRESRDQISAFVL